MTNKPRARRTFSDSERELSRLPANGIMVAPKNFPKRRNLSAILPDAVLRVSEVRNKAIIYRVK